MHPIAWALTATGRETEVLVVLSEQADLSQAAAIEGHDDRRWFVFVALASTAQRTQADLIAWLDARGAEHRSFHVVNALWTRADRDALRALSARPEVLRIEPNPRVRVVAPDAGVDPSPSTLATEWNVDRTNAPAAWPDGRGEGVVVGGQDTGVRWTHDALKAQYRGWDGTVASHDFNWHDAIHSAGSGNPCGSDSPFPCDDDGHGTHTVGTAVGDDGAGNQVGMAPGARWIACRNMDSGWGTPASYLECFDFFLAPYPLGATPADGDASLGADVTVNSWACPTIEGCSWDTLEVALAAQRAAGIMTVVAAGNSGSACGSITDPPGNSDHAYTVGATDDGDGLAGFSSRGPGFGTNAAKPDIVAPGVGVRSANASADDAYSAGSGTSMATPHVSGAVAVLWSARPTYRNEIDQTEALLNRTALRLPAVVEACGGDYVDGPNNSWGHGRLDVGRAVAEACPSPEAACADGFDGDCDGLEDCADPDCDGDAACPEALACTDGRDNDLDASVDCADPDCDGDAACPEALACADGRDNDLDASVDCADPDCDGDASCPEVLACTDGRDNDLDASVDCADADCDGDASCPEALACTDGRDNDLDASMDCADPDCDGDAACPEALACTDGRDNDQDASADCADPDCDGDAACPEALACTDARDNDLDSLVDCADPDCDGDASCPEVLACADGRDNDLDLRADCADPDCDGDASCPEALACTDGRDNDLDASVDCADPDCAGDAACPESGNCADAVDNDLDASVDCADPDCDGDASCPEALSCTDGRDNDLDTFTDCGDPDCAGNPACPEDAHCTDGFDNDLDALADCADDDCLADPSCLAYDFDGDGVPTGADCAPTDGGAFAIPPEVTLLTLRADAPTGDAILSWTDVSARAGTATTYEVTTDTLDALRAAGEARGACAPAAQPWRDVRALSGGGTFYLVRAVNACGPAAGQRWGVDSTGRARPGCP